VEENVMDTPTNQANRQSAASTNGTADALGQNGQAQANGARMDQAEELADHIMERAGYYTAWLGRAITRLAARAREEASDIWAEADHIRRQQKRS
jgi:hypothetical protein